MVYYCYLCISYTVNWTVVVTILPILLHHILHLTIHTEVTHIQSNEKKYIDIIVHACRSSERFIITILRFWTSIDLFIVPRSNSDVLNFKFPNARLWCPSFVYEKKCHNNYVVNVTVANRRTRISPCTQKKNRRKYSPVENCQNAHRSKHHSISIEACENTRYRTTGLRQIKITLLLQYLLYCTRLRSCFVSKHTIVKMSISGENCSNVQN